MSSSRRLQGGRGGFTLLELLGVMAIIVLMLALGVVAFNALTGRRSVSMAQNQVAAMMGRARAIAMNRSGGEPAAYGVFFFHDPQTDRTAMAILRVTAGATGDPDPNDNYKAWAEGVYYRAGDHVVAIVSDTSAPGRPFVSARRFYAVREHTASYTNRPPLVANEYPAYNDYWHEVTNTGNADIVPGEDFELLPVGVGVQTILDVTPADRYLRTGAILFDQQGRLDYLPYWIAPLSVVGTRMGLTTTMPPPSMYIYSQMGLVLYDIEQLKGQAGYSEADFLFQLPGQAAPAVADEQAEETWLDGNTSLLLVNRYSGELVRAR